MAHNIEINNGVASFAENGRKERAWHKLGQVFDRPMTVKEALEASHADYSVSLQDVAMITPEIALAMSNGSVPTDLLLGALVSGKKATMRTDKNKALGIVSSSYGVVQNLDAFTFIDTLCTGQVGGDHVPVIECAGVLGQGERVFITAKFPEDIILDNKGDDRVEMYMMFTTSHDGMGSVKCMVTNVRVVCQNTLNFAMRHNSGRISFRHSANVMSNLDLLNKENAEFVYKTLGIYNIYQKSFKESLEHLRNIKISERELDNIIAELTLSEEPRKLFFETRNIEHDDIPTRSRNIFIGMKEAIEGGVGQDLIESGNGLWAINGVTTFYQNNVNFKNEDAKFQSIMDGNVYRKVQKAYDLISV